MTTRFASTASTASFLSALIALAAGCTAAADGSATSSAADTAAEQAHAAHVQTVAKQTYGDMVDRMFGAYARGETALYKGTMSAHDNLSALKGRGGDGVIDGESVIATLGVVDGSLTLSAHAASKRHVDFVQLDPTSSPLTTDVSMVLSDSSNGGLLGACAGCIPDLRSRPAAIQVHGVEADGHFFDEQETPFHVTTTLDLTRQAVSAINFDDLLSANAVPGDFHADGPDMVQHVEDAQYDGLPAKPGMFGCWLQSSYVLDEWVRRNDLTKSGVRNFAITDVRTCCASAGREDGGAECAPPKQSKEFGTGVGARVIAKTTTEVISADGQVRRMLHVDYRDDAGYFGPSGSLQAIAIVHRPTFDGDKPVKLQWTLAAAALPLFSGDVELPDAATITEVELAFSNTAAARWDSNESKNYRFSF